MAAVPVFAVVQDEHTWTIPDLQVSWLEMPSSAGGSPARMGSVRVTCTASSRPLPGPVYTWVSQGHTVHTGVLQRKEKENARTDGTEMT